MKHLSNILTLAVLALFIAGSFLALEQVIGHPARYVEQSQSLGTS